MADYEHSSNYHKVVSKIKEINNLKDLDVLKKKLSELEQDDEVRELIEKCHNRTIEIKELINEDNYQKAVSEFDIEGDNLDAQISLFQGIEGYKEAKKYLDVLFTEKEYRSLVKDIKNENNDWGRLYTRFKALGDYKESQAFCAECEVKVENQRKERELQEQKKKEAELEKKYQNAMKSMEDNHFGYASLLFRDLGEYKDSRQKATECDKKKAEIQEKEQKAKKRHKRVIGLTLLAVFVVTLAAYLIFSLVSWKSDESGHWHSVLGSQVGYGGHNYLITKDVLPTCDEDGYQEYKCDKCGRTITNTIRATGHDLDEGVIVLEPTCTSTGTMVYTCKTCGKERTERINATGHKWVASKTVKPACVTDGYIEYRCSVCRTTKKEKTDAKGHSYVDGLCIDCGFDRNQYHVGDIGPAGGYIFYDCDADNNSGNKDGLMSTKCGWRFLEAAPADLRVVNGVPTVDSTLSGYSSVPTGYVFGYYRITESGSNLYVNGKTIYDASNCTGTAIGTGKSNTQLIVSAMGTEAYSYASGSAKTGNYAARLCDNLTFSFNGVTYDDWFLSSKDELNLMHTNLHKKGLGGFADDIYWTSSEYGNVNDARGQDFDNGNQGYDYRYYYYRVRAVRAF